MKWTNWILAVGLMAVGCHSQGPAKELTLPAVTQEAKPWTRWWWHGSAVSREGITAELEVLQQAGFGGVEITPIFGVKGEEDQFISYLSPEWVTLLEYTLKEADRLGLGVDMATGTGWPFGGPWVTDAEAAKNLVFKTYELQEGQSLSDLVICEQEPMVRAVRSAVTIDSIQQPVGQNPQLQRWALDQVRFPRALSLVVLMAYSDHGEVLDLTAKVSQGKLDWVAPAGQWTLCAAFQGWHGKMVERAAPGGEGFVIDHFSHEALVHYLTAFDTAFAHADLSKRRAFFNDSYEVDDARGQADWTPGFFNSFQTRRGYDLRRYLPALRGQSDSVTNSRVLTDYRETIAELLHENFTKTWKTWAAAKGALVRNQAHGSPANILDLYAEVDIPETEGTDLLKIKFASSAADVTGKRLVSSESATWLNEHFRSTLADVRHNLERYWLGGVNHVFYHGTAYSPATEAWPGRLFYAAIHANNRNSWWDDMTQLNTYVARVQSLLQASEPDNELLVYFPVYDRFSQPGHGLLEHFDIQGPAFNASSARAVGDSLLAFGVAFDWISDEQIQQLTEENGKLRSGGHVYRAILLPETHLMPLATWRKLTELAEAGVPVLAKQHLPEDVPGMANLEERRMEMSELKERISKWAIVADHLQSLISQAPLSAETMGSFGLQFCRKQYQGQILYWITNWGDSPIDQYVPLAKSGHYAWLWDPMTGRKGVAQCGENSVYLQLAPGESCFVFTADSPFSGNAYGYFQKKDPIAVTGNWHLHFLKGGPGLPEDQQLYELVSWTGLAGESGAAFSGTGSYTIHVNRPQSAADWYELDLGEVHESATVYLNGERMQTLIGPSFRMLIAADQLREVNELRVDVSNLMANRIRYMDLHHIEYRRFYNVNFPALLKEDSKNGLFHADQWDPLVSGLLGPVRLIPLQPMQL